MSPAAKPTLLASRIGSAPAAIPAARPTVYKKFESTLYAFARIEHQPLAADEVLGKAQRNVGIVLRFRHIRQRARRKDRKRHTQQDIGRKYWSHDRPHRKHGPMI